MDQIDLFDPLPRRWQIEVRWAGWRRCIWLAFQVDFELKAVGIVFFGLFIHAGKLIDWSGICTTTGRTRSRA